MKNVGKKIFACCGAFLMVTAMSITVFATTLTGSSLGHKNDKWEYCVQIYGFYSKCANCAPEYLMRGLINTYQKELP